MVILFFCFYTLTGCLGEDVKTINEEVVKAEEKPKKITGKNKMNHEDQVIINIVDPHTNKVIKTFTPHPSTLEANLNNFIQDIENWVSDLAKGTATENGYNQKMTLDKLKDGKIIKGNPEIVVREKELVEKILEYSYKGGNVELPLSITESGYKPEDALVLNEVVLASYTTYFNTSKVGRSTNIKLSAESIHNTIVGSGDIFSFNTTVGPRNKENGYQLAPEIVNGNMVMGIGGGICQTSSTLFNAVDQIGVEYVEWHHHSADVGYVPKGRDATVSFGGLDFRFQNTTGIPLLIKTYVSYGSITVEVRTSKEYADLLKYEL